MREIKVGSVISPKVYRDQLVTIADLAEFKEDLLLSLYQLMQGQLKKSPPKWLRSHEVRAILKVSNNTLQNMRTRGVLPYTKIGNAIYYDREKINTMLGGDPTIPSGSQLPAARSGK